MVMARKEHINMYVWIVLVKPVGVFSLDAQQKADDDSGVALIISIMFKSIAHVQQPCLYKLLYVILYTYVYIIHLPIYNISVYY